MHTLSHPSRREFLQRVGVGGVAGWTLLGVHQVRPTVARERGANEKLNLAAVGVGNRGGDNLIPLQTENMVAVCDVDDRYLRRVKERFPHAKPYHDFRELLDRKDLDAVVVSCPDHTHAHAVWQALQGGRHVYCEKPLAHSVHEVRLLAKAAQQTQLVTQFGNHHHAKPGYRQAVAWVRSGALGEIREVHSWTTRPIWPQGIPRPKETPATPEHLQWDLWIGPAPWRPYHPAYHPLTWRGWWDFGCGALGDMGPHLLDPVFWALKLTPPVSVQAKSSPLNDETLPTWSIVDFDFPKRGDLPALKLTWYDGGKRPPPERTGVRRLPPNGCLLLGEHGNLFIPAYGSKPVMIPKAGTKRPTAPPPYGEASPGHHEDWLKACRSGGPALSDFSYGAALTETCLLGNVAIRSRKRIEWDTKTARITNAPDAERFLKREYRKGWELDEAEIRRPKAAADSEREPL